MKKYVFLLSIILLSFILFSCEDVFDKKNLAAVSDKDVYNDPIFATAFINNIILDNSPEWNTTISAMTDNSVDAGFAGVNLNRFMTGQYTADDVNYWPYDKIRSINVFLKNIDGGSIDENTKSPLKGQAFFYRAYQYFQMVLRYGGVPLILKPQEISDDLLVSRNKTSECIAQITNDLDMAASLLPKSWSGNDLGRVTKGTAMALKGRVLMFYASPQFNPSNDINRWQSAYDANLAAKNELEADGYGLYNDFEKIWFDEMNKEVVWATRYQYPGRVNTWSADCRPLDESQGSSYKNMPTLGLVNAFPMKNGLPITDPASGYDSTKFWVNRDPRFQKTVAYNGCIWELSGKKGRRQWTYIGSQQSGNAWTGYLCRKAVDVNLDPYYASRSGVDWIEIRFAEVLLNYAECANEVGKTDEAYNVLKMIRNRAGIEAGNNKMYGLKENMSQLEMRQAIELEKRLEFAFEAKRYWDLRRLKGFQNLNGTTRKGHKIELKITKEKFQSIADTVNLLNSYNTYFKTSVVILDNIMPINVPSSYDFFAIPQSHLEQNSHLEQTKGWNNGTFDPLQ